jgi:hypothetical protein
MVIQCLLVCPCLTESLGIRHSSRQGILLWRAPAVRVSEAMGAVYSVYITVTSSLHFSTSRFLASLVGSVLRVTEMASHHRFAIFDDAPPTKSII